MIEAELGSQVDLFPTIAHAAGCRPTAGDELGFKLKLCNDKTRRPCDTASDCSGSTACVERTLEGRSLLPVISATVKANYAEKSIDLSASRRNLAYVRWNTPKDPDLAVSSRRGYFASGGGCIPLDGEDTSCVVAEPAAKVCSYSFEREPNPGIPSELNSAIGRIRRGGSCSTGCETDADCVGVTCKVNGLFCVENDDEVKSICRGEIPGTCDPTLLTRCTKRDSSSTNECGSGRWCMEVVTKCKACSDAAWKLSAREDLTGYELFDLNSNPEESGRLNCLADPDFQVDPSLEAVRTHLHAKLESWKINLPSSGPSRAEP
jgi:hypothetical protein